MPEALTIVASALPGVATGIAVLALARRQPAVKAIAGRLAERADVVLTDERGMRLRHRLALEIDRAGWRESAGHIAVLTCVLSTTLSALGIAASAIAGTSTATSVALAGGVAGVASVWWALRSAVNNRRRRLVRELAPLLELFVLELGGGGSALLALGSVSMQIDGELAAEVRRLLIASQVSGSATFESRLRAYADHMRIPQLASLATILTASREYGTAVTQGVRALAADLRRAQRRELIAHSRRALNHVLFPAAIGVLLPFLAILLYPAISSLQANLR